MTLQEYLIKLGWSVDEPSLKKFLGAVSATGARTAELGSVAIETAAAIELMVTRVARKYETLYYVSQRTNQSVKYIQSTQFAFKQIGLSAEDANHNIESIAATIRTQPWLKAIFGGASTPQDIAKRLGNSGLPYFLQTKFAEMIGMDEKTLFHLQRFGDVEAAAQANFARRQKDAGIDPDTLAKQTASFGREVNNLESSLEILGDRMAINFLGPTQKGIHNLSEMVDWFTQVDNATKGWATTLATLGGTAGGLYVVEKILRRIWSGPGKTTTLGGRAALLTKLGRGKLGGSWLRGSWIGAAFDLLEMVKENDPAKKAELQKELGPLLYELGLSKTRDLSTDPDKQAIPATRGGDRAKQAVEFFKNAGFPLASAQGIAAGLYSESKLDTKSVNPTTGATGIAQWLGGRKSQFNKTFGHDLADATFEEQLQYVLYELTKGNDQGARLAGKSLAGGGLGSRAAAGTFIHLFERPGAAGEMSDMSRAGPMADALSGLTPQPSGGDTNNVTLHSKTDVHVDGGSSPADAYKRAADDTNSTLLRNIVGVMR
jgi:Phage tail lysozyme